MRRLIWILMEPDSNNMLKPGYKSLRMLAKWSMKIKRENKLEFLEMKKKEDHGHSQQIKLYNFTVSLFDKRKVLYLISIAIEAVDIV